MYAINSRLKVRGVVTMENLNKRIRNEGKMESQNLLLPHVHTCIYQVSVNLVYEMFDLDPAGLAALVAQLVRASVWSAECCGFKCHLRATHFSFFHWPQVPVFLSFFLSFFSSQVVMHIYMYIKYRNYMISVRATYM